ncbi:LPXTG cell wall anchor domain-containing protein [Glycomyces sp. NPDC047010]|uniref:LPXTG cell wall anchor domain-containing protein n=1 Tax=Glycomyces sp. NPDC047010 TaxID=3155023 RepID=UPI0033C8B22C
MNAPSPRARRTARLAATAGAAALGAGLFALPAYAQAPVPVDVVHPSSHLITADGAELEGSLTVVFGDDFAEGEHDVTAVFDLAPSTGVVYWADNDPSYGGCGPDATTGLLHCSAEDADRTVDFSYMYAAEPEAAPGEHPYTITIAVDGETVLTVDETMEVVAPTDGLAYWHSDIAFDGVEPGSTVQVSPEFLQEGPLPTDTVAVVVTVRGADYLSNGLARPVADYDNCLAEEYAVVYCAVTDFPDEQGTAFTFSDPVGIDVDAAAPGPMNVCGCSYTVEALDQQMLDDWFGGVFWDEGSANLFGIEPVADPGSEFVDSYAGYIDVGTAEHPYDLAVSDGTVKGGKGDEVKTEVDVRNLGTAAAPAVFDGPGSYALIVDLPAGVEPVAAEAVGEWSYCEDDAADYFRDTMPDADLDGADVVCLFEAMGPESDLAFELTVKVTDPGADADGSVQVVAFGNPDYPGDLDADQANNTAVLRLDGDGSGALPKTGSSLTWILTGAAAALVVGIALFVATTRRRKGGGDAAE